MISIIIPVYKVEKYISRCLDSILNQTFQDFEIILINDASPDNSIRIAESYADKDSRIRIIHNEENSGAGWSRMVGYTHAKGEYITFCDPDDYLPENALEILYEAITRDSTADMCIGDYQRVYPDGSKSEVFENKLKYGNDKLSVAKSTLKYETPHYLWNKIYKTKLFRHNEIIAHKDFSKSSDEFLFFQVLQYCEKIINVNEVVYYYFDNQESASYNKSNIIAMKAMLISQNYVDDLYKNNEEFKSIIQKRRTQKFAHFLKIADNNKELLKLLFDNKIDSLFTPWSLLKNFHKSKALNVFLMYLKRRIASVF